jgi:hypothetical protein
VLYRGLFSANRRRSSANWSSLTRNASAGNSAEEAIAWNNLSTNGPRAEAANGAAVAGEKLHATPAELQPPVKPACWR